MNQIQRKQKSEKIPTRCIVGHHRTGDDPGQGQLPSEKINKCDQSLAEDDLLRGWHDVIHRDPVNWSRSEQRNMQTEAEEQPDSHSNRNQIFRI